MLQEYLKKIAFSQILRWPVMLATKLFRVKVMGWSIAQPWHLDAQFKLIMKWEWLYFTQPNTRYPGTQNWWLESSQEYIVLLEISFGMFQFPGCLMVLRIFEGVEPSLFAEHCGDDEVPSVLILEKSALIVLATNAGDEVNPLYQFEISFSVDLGQNTRKLNTSCEKQSTKSCWKTYIFISATHCCPILNIISKDFESDLTDIQGFELGTYLVRNNKLTRSDATNLTYYSYIEDVIPSQQSILKYR